MHLLNHFVAELWACSLALVALSVIKVPTIIDRITRVFCTVYFLPKNIGWVQSTILLARYQRTVPYLGFDHVPLVRDDSRHSHISPMSTNQQVCVHFRSRSEPHELFQSSIWRLQIHERVLHTVIKDLYLAPGGGAISVGFFSHLGTVKSTVCIRP